MKRTDSSHLYVLVGTGLGACMAVKPHWFFGDLGREEDSDVLSMVAVCDAGGHVHSMHSDELVVVSIDGQSPGDVIAAAR